MLGKSQVAVEEQNGRITDRTEDRITFSGRRAGFKTNRALTLATSGFVVVSNEGEWWRARYEVRMTSSLVIAVLAAFWIGVPLFLAKNGSPGLAACGAVVVFLFCSGLSFMISKGSFPITLKRFLETNPFKEMPNHSLQRALTPAGFGPLNSKR